jgi:hypothetical protein
VFRALQTRRGPRESGLFDTSFANAAMPIHRRPARPTSLLREPLAAGLATLFAALLLAACAGTTTAPTATAPAAAASAAAPASAPAPLLPASSATLPTVADITVRGKVLDSIAVFEQAAGRSDKPRLLSVESLGSIDDTWIERWTVRSGGRRIGYSVKFRRAPDGEVDFTIEKLADATTQR